MLTTKDSYEYLKGIPDFYNDIIYSDPPYALGSEVIIRKDGKVDYKKASDFMSKWDMPTGEYWEKWFQEAYRTLKHGGFLLMFGMDRQLLLFKYYAQLSGFEEQQSLYWYFISNFPKATDLSKAIDKNLGEEREVVGQMKSAGYLREDGGGDGWAERIETKSTSTTPEFSPVTVPKSELAKKYDGFKYSVSPLKQTCETIMVFKKPCKTGSVLHDMFAYEKGDKTITVSALNIEGNRVGTEKRVQLGTKATNGDVYNAYPESDGLLVEVEGRYPAQTFVDSEVAEILDVQSGVSRASAFQNKYAQSTGLYEMGIDKKEKLENGIVEGYDDIGGCSKILQKCDFERGEMDIFIYEPKVSGAERNAGLEGFTKKRVATLVGADHDGELDDVSERFRTSPSANPHPTLKPISLNEKILLLFKTPNEQIICYPFAGAGSEVIGGIKAGFDNWHGCEINQEYVDIANARIEYWQQTMFTQTSIFDFI